MGERVRGKICRLCDRKFYIKNAIGNSIKTIDIQSQTLKMLQMQVDKFSNELEDLNKDKERQLQIIGNQLQAVEPDIKHFEEVEIKYTHEYELGEQERWETEQKYKNKIADTEKLKDEIKALEQARFDYQESLY